MVWRRDLLTFYRGKIVQTKRIAKQKAKFLILEIGMGRLKIENWRLKIGDWRLKIEDWKLGIEDWKLKIGLRPKLLTLGRLQASLTLPSLNRNFENWELKIESTWKSGQGAKGRCASPLPLQGRGWGGVNKSWKTTSYRPHPCPSPWREGITNTEICSNRTFKEGSRLKIENWPAAEVAHARQTPSKLDSALA